KQTSLGAAMAGIVLRLLFLLCAAAGPALGWDRPGKVLLADVQALTLYRGQYTTSRRTAAVPQLQCTGGSAGCSRVPEVVQCYSKGWDGYDVQWQCRADLENAFRFGQMEVSCEGYDYPDDPYVLRGSCSLLFSLELTEEGERKVKNSGNDSDSGSGAIVVIVLLVLAFGVYKLLLSNQQSQQNSGHSDGFSQPFWQSQQTPSPPGFKSTFTGRAQPFTIFKRASRIPALYYALCSKEEIRAWFSTGFQGRLPFKPLKSHLLMLCKHSLHHL
uniref:Store-operated calcium entry-associated regulatory factor n=1 Tax=Catharus ustulatus TaxID=91951 RepID=A0A8C3TN89_CATUS